MKKRQYVIVILTVILSFCSSESPGEFISPGKLTESHNKLSGLKNCIKCHTLGEGLSDSSCKSCHEKLIDRLNQNKGFHATISGKCTDCHTEHKGENYDIAAFNQKQFDHKKTGYELKDSHRVSCNKCHKQKKTYLGLSTECFRCHTDVHQKSLSTDCLTCHNYETWKTVKFEHDIYSQFTLTGKHKEAACEGCHPEEVIRGTGEKTVKTYKVLKFKPIKSGKCNDCHYEIHKGTLKEKTCKNCHSTDGWAGTTVDHNKLSDFKLEGKHQEVSCDLCHPKVKTLAGLKGREIEKLAGKLTGIDHGRCNDCHFDIHKEAFKDKKCGDCHTVKREWKQTTFRHDSDEYKGFKLEGRHTEVDCEKCHARSEVRFTEFKKSKTSAVGTFSDLKSGRCNDCHVDIHKEAFKDKKCGDCHTVKREWKQTTFRHDSDEYKGFKLEGRHTEVDCEKCHARSEVRFTEFNTAKIAVAGNFSSIKSESCSDCHFDVHQGKFAGNKCENCHSVRNEWKKHIFRHESDAYRGFKLEGKHSEVDCEKCHARSEIEFTEFNISKKASVGNFRVHDYESCAACHNDEHKGQYDQDCKICHSPHSWEPKKNLHNPVSFELQGAHKTLKCEQCHMETQTYTGLESDCFSCHKDFHANRFGQACMDCHRQSTWIPADFKHTGVGFRLTGIHKTLDCRACHINNDYSNTPSDCFLCHQDDYQSAPNHILSGYSHDCSECHSASGPWSQVNYSHPSFDFRGAHNAIRNDCSTCHNNSGKIQAGTTDNDCYNCHSVSGVADSSYENTGSPSHTALNFSTSCTDCHSLNTWMNARYSHQGFHLRGVHVSLDCNTCHQSGYPGQYAGTPEDDCYTCHANDHSQQHPSYPQNCTQCHAENAWLPATGFHTSYQLKGIHTSLDCLACHQSGYPGQYAGTTEDDCYTCHANDHSQQHPAYPQDCTQCHSSSAWLPATLSHQNFQLRGVHASLDCNMCHQSGYPGQYAGTPEDDCYTCHANDHSQQHPSYPQDCTQCHSENAWLPATGFHSSYQLRGIHATLNCIVCHQSGYPGQYAGTNEDDCYTCHANDHSQQHPSYPQDCTQCHSENAWLPASFSHQYFNLILIHNSFTCAQCHQTGYPGQYAGISEDDCFACHSDDYFKEHQSTPHDCLQCHDGYTWEH